MRRRALLSAGKEESPYAFYFTIELKAEEVWVANAEQLVEINKMLEIMVKYLRDSLGVSGGIDIGPETMPPEFDLRVNGERKYWGFYWSGGNTIPDDNEVINVYITFDTPIGMWFGAHSFIYGNPVFDSFRLVPYY